MFAYFLLHIYNIFFIGIKILLDSMLINSMKVLIDICSVLINDTEIVLNMGCTLGKRVFGHMQTAKPNISLCIYAV